MVDERRKLGAAREMVGRSRTSEIERRVGFRMMIVGWSSTIESEVRNRRGKNYGIFIDSVGGVTGGSSRMGIPSEVG